MSLAVIEHKTILGKDSAIEFGKEVEEPEIINSYIEDKPVRYDKVMRQAYYIMIKDRGTKGSSWKLYMTREQLEEITAGLNHMLLNW